MPAVIWDAVLFPGARRWAHPNMFMPALQAWWTGDRERTPLPAFVAHMLSLDGVAEGPSAGGTRASDAAARQAAEEAYLRLRRLEMRSSAGDDGPTIQAMHKAIHRATIALRNRCGLDEVRAKGWPMPAEARVDPNRDKPDLASEHVLNGTLTPFGLILSPFAPYHLAPSDVHYTDLAFCGADLRSIWPNTNRAGRPREPKAPVEVRGRQPERLRKALDWMRTAASRGTLPKRDSALTECRQATGCTYRQARDAWNSLPAEVRGTRGQPATRSAKG